MGIQIRSARSSPSTTQARMSTPRTRKAKNDSHLPAWHMKKMGRLFLYLSSREPVDIPPVAESPWQQAIGVLVFQNSSKELGFDEDESTTLLNGLLRNALLLEWAPAPQPHKSSPQANRTLVRRHSSRGLFALLAPSEMLAK